MKRSVYVETTVVSYLTGRPSRDLVTAARQQTTLEWWEIERPNYDTFVSELVVREAAGGDDAAAQRRAAALHGIALLDVNEATLMLADALVEQGAVPVGEEADALHIAVAAVHGVDFLLTWNFGHINNAERKEMIVAVVERHGLECPVICSPDELGRYYP